MLTKFPTGAGRAGLSCYCPCAVLRPAVRVSSSLAWLDGLSGANGASTKSKSNKLGAGFPVCPPVGMEVGGGWATKEKLYGAN